MSTIRSDSSWLGVTKKKLLAPASLAAQTLVAAQCKIDSSKQRASPVLVEALRSASFRMAGIEGMRILIRVSMPQHAGYPSA